MKKVSLYTLGCKLNQAETAIIAEGFQHRGFQEVPFGEKADVVFINTCTVTGRTDYCSRRIIRKSIQQFPQAFTIVGGCYSRLAEGEVANIRGVDLVVGTDNKFDLFNYLDGLQKHHTAVRLPVHLPSQECRAPHPGVFSARTRALLKIQDGCDQRCVFCAVPLARGQSRSSIPEDVISRARVLAERGHKEIVLTGVHIGRYGLDLCPPSRLLKLLALLLQAVQGVRFRLSSMEPQEIGDELLAFIASTDRICPHFHVPLQSGSDRILRLMNRCSTGDGYRKVIERISAAFPHAGLGADVIVGFPGEEKADFEKTYRMVRELPFTYFHVFRYSPRHGTKAAEMKDDVGSPLKAERSEKLRLLSEKKRRSFIEQCIGMQVKVLFERQDSAGRATGLSPNYIRVCAYSPQSIAKSIREVRIESVNAQGIALGRVVE